MTNVEKYTEYIKRKLNRHTILVALIISVFLIVAAVGLGWYNNKIVPRNIDQVAVYTGETSNPLSFLSNWDGPDYIKLSLHGYTNVEQASFFPLYPILIHVLDKVIHSSLISALIISWTCLVGCHLFYIKILRRIIPSKNNLNTLKGLAFFVLFPTSVFLVATYTESLFAFLSLAAIYYALDKKYILSGLLMLLGCITHLDGIFVLALVCMILWEGRVKLKKIITTLVLGLIGLAGYSYYLGVKFSHPLSFILSQKSHGWLNHHYTEIFQSIDFFNVVFIVLLLLTIVYWWNRRRSFSYYSFLFLLIPIIGNQFGGFNRYMLVAFPVQFMAYDYFKNKHLSYAFLLALMGIIWAYFTLQYAGGYIGG
ncbi:MAG: mannosyltransferase family protein [Candidatus Saccharibacteria bacterium]